MALNEEKWTELWAEYEIGNVTIKSLAAKYGISREHITRKAKDEGRKYGERSHEYHTALEKRTVENLFEKDVDKSTQYTIKFLADIGSIRNLCMNIAGELAKEKKSKVKLSKEEADRIFAQSKIAKITMETLNIGYTGARKALGMDREEELKRAMPKVDPTEGLTESEIDAKLADIQ